MPAGGVHLWETLTTEEMAALDPAGTVAVLPVAAIEQHGPHLPLGTDAIICDGILDAACARLDPTVTILRLPTQRIGHSPEHQGFPGTLSLGASTLLALWCDIGRSVAAAGVRKLLLFNSHGGQGALVDLVAQALRDGASMTVARCSYYRFALPDGWISERERRFGLHGGQVETSLMLHIAPHLVRLDCARHFASRAEAWEAAHPGLPIEGKTGIGWRAEDLNAEGVTGDAASASAELGAQLLRHYATLLATLIEELRRFPTLPWP
jgi:creatinine amidohydrolase